MSPPIYSVGQVWGAADVNNWAIPQAVYMTSTQHFSNNTLANVTQLVATVAANAVYAVELSLAYDGATASDFQISWTGPASYTNVNTYLSGLPSTAVAFADAVVLAETSNPSFGCLGAGTFCGLKWESLVTTAGTAGSLQLKAAQLVTGGTDTIIESGSYLIVTRVG